MELHLQFLIFTSILEVICRKRNWKGRCTLITSHQLVCKLEVATAIHGVQQDNLLLRNREPKSDNTFIFIHLNHIADCGLETRSTIFSFHHFSPGAGYRAVSNLLFIRFVAHPMTEPQPSEFVYFHLS